MTGIDLVRGALPAFNTIAFHFWSEHRLQLGSSETLDTKALPLLLLLLPYLACIICFEA